MRGWAKRAAIPEPLAPEHAPHQLQPEPALAGSPRWLVLRDGRVVQDTKDFAQAIDALHRQDSEDAVV